MKASLIYQGSLVMAPLFVISLIAILIFFERVFFLHKGYMKAPQFLEGIKSLLEKQRLLEALTLCQSTPGPIPSIIKTALVHHKEPIISIREHLQSLAIIELPCLERRLNSLYAISFVAPFLGLLGTVISFFQAFVQMEAVGPYANASLFAGMVASALMATAASLGLAALAYLGYCFLKGRVRAIIHDMEYVAHEILYTIHTLYHKPENKEKQTS